MNARMSAMAKTLGGFRAALLIGWSLLGVAGLYTLGRKAFRAGRLYRARRLPYQSTHSIWSRASLRARTGGRAMPGA